MIDLGAALHVGGARRRARRIIVAACAVIAVAADASAADIKAGRQKALQCQACHGLDGQAKLPDSANLAGQNEVYLVKALKDSAAARARTT